MMKISCRLLAAAAVLLVLFTGCDKSGEEEVHWDAKPAVMIDGVLYLDTGHLGSYRTDEAPDKGGHVDGEITSTVAGHEFPNEDDQSNFGAGYYYRYGEDDTVEVFFDSSRNWVIFEPNETE